MAFTAGTQPQKPLPAPIQPQAQPPQVMGLSPQAQPPAYGAPPQRRPEPQDQNLFGAMTNDGPMGIGYGQPRSEGPMGIGGRQYGRQYEGGRGGMAPYGQFNQARMGRSSWAGGEDPYGQGGENSTSEFQPNRSSIFQDDGRRYAPATMPGQGGDPGQDQVNTLGGGGSAAWDEAERSNRANQDRAAASYGSEPLSPRQPNQGWGPQVGGPPQYQQDARRRAEGQPQNNDIRAMDPYDRGRFGLTMPRGRY